MEEIRTINDEKSESIENGTITEERLGRLIFKWLCNVLTVSALRF